VTIFNYLIARGIVYKDLDPVNSLFIKEINHFALEFSPFIKNYSPKDFIVINNIFLNKQSNYLGFLI
jgi:hypothetical protein